MKEQHHAIMAELGLPKPLAHLINGELRAEPKKMIPAIDPTTQEVIAEIPPGDGRRD